MLYLNVFKRLIALIMVSTISLYGHASVLNIDPASVEAQAWLIYDPQSQQILAQSAADQQRAPASLTKMMVAYLSLKAIQQGRLSLDQQIIVPAVVSTVKSDESRLRLKPNDVISVQDLLSGLIIMSANDAALTLASIVAQDVPHFVGLMNSTAGKLGMQHSHFANPSGISMDSHYSSAHDMALLAQAIVRETPEYLHYSSQAQFSYHGLQHHATNLLLTKDPTVDGMKTGYTQAAGYNLVLSANRLDLATNEYRRLIVVVMGTASAKKRAEVADKLLNLAYSYTQNQRWHLPAQTIAEIPVINGHKPRFSIHSTAQSRLSSFSLLPNDQRLNLQQFDSTQMRIHQAQGLLQPLSRPAQIHYQVVLKQQQLHAPLAQSALDLAQIKVEQFQQPLSVIDVAQAVQLDEASWWHRLLNWLQQLFGRSEPLQMPKLYPLKLQ